MHFISTDYFFFMDIALRRTKKGIVSSGAAAFEGYLDAAFTLGEIFSDKSQEGLHDPNEAYRYFQFAAEKDHIEAQHILGIVLVRGDIYADQQSRGLAQLGTAASKGLTFSAILQAICLSMEDLVSEKIHVSPGIGMNYAIYLVQRVQLLSFLQLMNLTFVMNQFKV